MDEKDRQAVTQLPPPPDTPSDVAAAASTIPPIGGDIPAELAPESEPTLRAEPEAGHGASDEQKLLSTNQLISLYQQFRTTQADLMAEDGGFAKLLGRRDERLVTSFAQVVDNSVAAGLQRLEPRFAAMERELQAVRAQADVALKIAREALDRVAVLEKQRGQGSVAEGSAPAAAT